MVLPSGFTSRSPAIDTADGPVDEAFPPMSVTVRLDRRDRHLPRRHDLPAAQRAGGRPGHRGDDLLDGRDRSRCGSARKYAIKHTTRTARAVVRGLQYRLDVNTLHRDETAHRAAAQRDRPGPAAHHRAAAGRRVPPQPHHRRLHPHRRDHQPHRRRRHDHRGCCSRPLRPAGLPGGALHLRAPAPAGSRSGTPAARRCPAQLDGQSRRAPGPAVATKVSGRGEAAAGVRGGHRARSPPRRRPRRPGRARSRRSRRRSSGRRTRRRPAPPRRPGRPPGTVISKSSRIEACDAVSSGPISRDPPGAQQRRRCRGPAGSR